MHVPFITQHSSSFCSSSPYLIRQRGRTRRTRLCHFVNRRWRCHREKFRRWPRGINVSQENPHASKRPYFLGVVVVRRERANRPSVTRKLDLPLLPITLHAALVAVGASLCTLWITMLSIDSIRLDSTRNPTPHAFTRAHLYPTIVTSFRLSTSKDPSRPSSSVSLGVTHSSFREFTLRVDVVIVMLWHFHGTRGIRRWKFLHDEQITQLSHSHSLNPRGEDLEDKGSCVTKCITIHSSTINNKKFSVSRQYCPRRAVHQNEIKYSEFTGIFAPRFLFFFANPAFPYFRRRACTGVRTGRLFLRANSWKSGGRAMHVKWRGRPWRKPKLDDKFSCDAGGATRAAGPKETVVPV